MIPGAGMICETPPESFFNLPLVLAFAVLDQVLDELIDQGTIPRPSGRRPLLGAKMTESRSHLPWRDYQIVDEGREARNGIAHRGELVNRTDSLKFVDAIENELHAWSIL